MKRAWKILLVCALIIGGVYACNEVSYRNFSLRYRLTVSVEDNGQIKTGTSVIETRYESPAGFFCFPLCGRLLRFYGNAPTIDLGAKGLLFVIDLPSLIRRNISRDAPTRDRQERNNLGNLPFRAHGYDIDVQPLKLQEEIERLKHTTRSVTVPPLWLPMIAHFRDINKPKSIEEVDPLDMAATLGPGVRFVDATLQITNESVTLTPSDWPEWLRNGPETRFEVNGLVTEILTQEVFRRN